MQRDVYAGLIKKRNRPRIQANILQLNGRVTHEALMEEVFVGYRSRRIVLMTNTAGQDPRLPTLSTDRIIPSFDVLARIHQPHYQYRLLPLICDDLETFAAMQAICSSPGSPFSLSDRMDPKELTYRFHTSNGKATKLNSLANKKQIAQYFEPYLSEAERMVPLASRRMPIIGVEFQGVLCMQAKFRPGGHLEQQHGTDEGGKTEEASAAGTEGKRFLSAAALITTHEVLSEVSIIQRALLRDFFNSPLLASLLSNTAPNRMVHSAQRQYHFMVVKRPVARPAPAAAPLTAVGSSRRRTACGGGEDGLSLTVPGPSVTHTAALKNASAISPGMRSDLSVQSRRALLELAKSKGLFVYEKVAEGQYQFACCA